MSKYYTVCEKCGAHLDPGEVCDCDIPVYECVYCGKNVVYGEVCSCMERRNALERIIAEADGLDFEQLGVTGKNLSIGIEEMSEIIAKTDRSIFEVAWMCYKVGILFYQEQPRKDASTRSAYRIIITRL